MINAKVEHHKYSEIDNGQSSFIKQKLPRALPQSANK
jgi:hypothetical protein